MHIGYVPRERPPFSALNFRSGAYHFHKLPKNPFWSITILHFLADFAVPEIIIFKISFISTHASPPTAGSAWTQSVRQRREFAAVLEIRIFTLKMDQARSGDSHFHAQNGSSSFRSPPFSSLFRSPTFSRSTGSPFRSPCPFFTLPRHIPTKIWGDYCSTVRWGYAWSKQLATSSRRSRTQRMNLFWTKGPLSGGCWGNYANEPSWCYDGSFIYLKCERGLSIKCCRTYQMKSWQCEQNVGWRRNVDMNLWPLTWWTRLLTAPRLLCIAFSRTLNTFSFGRSAK